ncbi:hypothetical protein P153DRAFT_408402 [Dothidotthia symphoricarpi CBS 119687]|uniref:Uncharacterized protein n=1 Tax=Dothidotthia symphoricarpi CBS 119687 TaxID=1392245 RepID=A0A6A6A2R6_9PLEO|nr:uncharacterized protein P153DRAFT_408402 [Dothidotthia symphoricarpi CBS 119687]KAF2126302.1 hypothetical protein P153DRAFT_408402 [Dothidotthia symphoricarpi CBS 119687]
MATKQFNTGDVPPRARPASHETQPFLKLDNTRPPNACRTSLYYDLTSLWHFLDSVASTKHPGIMEDTEALVLKLVRKVPPPYTPLRNEEYRVMHLQPQNSNGIVKCSFVSATVEERAGKYNAMSYCWGPMPQPRKIPFLERKANGGNSNIVHHALCLAGPRTRG